MIHLSLFTAKRVSAVRGLFFIIGIVFSCVSFASSNPVIVWQLEAGFNIEKSLAERLVRELNLKSQKRADFYADIFDGQNFLLIPSLEKYKFRLKSGEKKSVLQANTKAAMTQMSCSPEMRFTVKSKNVGELNLSEQESSAFRSAVTRTLDLIHQGAGEKLVSQDVLKFEALLKTLPVPLMDQLLAVAQGKDYAFVPSHITHKIKWKGNLTKSPNVEVSVTEAQDYIGTHFFQTKYEIEFQIEGSNAMTPDQLGQQICDFMHGFRVDPIDLNPSRQKVQEQTLQLLIPYGKVIIHPADASSQDTSSKDASSMDASSMDASGKIGF